MYHGYGSIVCVVSTAMQRQQITQSTTTTAAATTATATVPTVTIRTATIVEPNDFKPYSPVNGGSVTAPTAAPEAFDEVAFLLDDGNVLDEPPLCNDHDQEYDVGGSQNDLDLTLQLDSPYETSWYEKRLSWFPLRCIFSSFKL